MGNVAMLAYLPIALFAVTAVIVAAALADAFVRFGNAWGVTRREMSRIDADLTLETWQSGKVIAAHGPAQPRPVATEAGCPAAPRAPLACAA